MKGYYVSKKNDFHSSIEKVIDNGLKFILIDPSSVHKYQRNLLQEIVSNVFRSENFLSVVLKLEVSSGFKQGYELFCYVEDVSFQNNLEIRKIDCLVEDFNKLYIEEKQ